MQRIYDLFKLRPGSILENEEINKDLVRIEDSDEQLEASCRQQLSDLKKNPNEYLEKLLSLYLDHFHSRIANQIVKYELQQYLESMINQKDEFEKVLEILFRQNYSDALAPQLKKEVQKHCIKRVEKLLNEKAESDPVIAENLYKFYLKLYAFLPVSKVRATGLFSKWLIANEKYKAFYKSQLDHYMEEGDSEIKNHIRQLFQLVNKPFIYSKACDFYIAARLLLIQPKYCSDRVVSLQKWAAKSISSSPVHEKQTIQLAKWLKSLLLNPKVFIKNPDQVMLRRVPYDLEARLKKGMKKALEIDNAGLKELSQMNDIQMVPDEDKKLVLGKRSNSTYPKVKLLFMRTDSEPFDRKPVNSYDAVLLMLYQMIPRSIFAKEAAAKKIMQLIEEDHVFFEREDGTSVETDAHSINYEAACKESLLIISDFARDALTESNLSYAYLGFLSSLNKADFSSPSVMQDLMNSFVKNEMSVKKGG